MSRDRIQMHIKYCETFQLNKLKTIEKYPHELLPIKVPSKAWSQIGETNRNFTFIDIIFSKSLIM